MHIFFLRSLSKNKISLIIPSVLLLNSVVFSNNTRANKDSVSMYFAGDVTLANHFENFVGDRYAYAFEKLGWFSGADISMVNLENPLTTKGLPVEKRFTFKARPDYTRILQQGGIDIVTIANNHIYDYGNTGLMSTIDTLHNAGIYYVGAGRNFDEAEHPVIFYSKGLKIAVFGFYGTHKHSDCHPATRDSSGTALRNLGVIENAIKKYRDQVDYIVINFHWGEEKANYPDNDQISFAHSVIDFGADLIVGHHPHVLQGIEKYNDKYIVYSLGNFIFGGNSRTFDRTAVLAVSLKKNAMSVKIIPVDVKLWQPYKATGSDSIQVMQNMKEYSKIFKKSIF